MAAKRKANVAPSASVDFWKLLEAERAQEDFHIQPPAGTFTKQEYMERFKLRNTQHACRELQMLINGGKVAMVGQYGHGHKNYYRFCG